ncbi:MAG: adenylate/guanylate cyclase domain-containing protein [Patescibacteria group bacterium]
MSKKITSVLISLGAGVITFISLSLGLFSGTENFFSDILFSHSSLNPQIIVVEIDNDSLQKLGQWPWPRRYFADALLALENAPGGKPKSAGIDVLFAEPSRVGPGDDAILQSALSAISYGVVLPTEGFPLLLAKDKIPSAPNLQKTLPIFLDRQNTKTGHINLILDADNIVRKFPVKIFHKGELINSFAYELAKSSANELPNYSDTLDVERIFFKTESRSIRRIPFYRLFEEIPSGFFKDKIVLIGATAADLHDEKATPLSKGTQMPGVEIQAQILNMFLSGERLREINPTASAVWIMLAAGVPLVLFFAAESIWIFILGAIGFGVLQIVASAEIFTQGTLAPIVHINISWIISSLSLLVYRYLALDKEKRKIKNIFGKYVSKEILSELLKNPKSVSLGGEEREITILFSDIRGFTKLSEKTTPQELVFTLNKYFTSMTGAIMRNRGVVDKFIGDAIMAFWGAPLPEKNHADLAVIAAKEMLEELHKFNSELKNFGKEPIDIGVGIYTGKAVVGNIGSEERFDYTAIGDTVNVASRLEGLNKEYGTHIILGETTKNKLSKTENLKSLGKTSVKGRNEQIEIYSLE